MKTIEIYGKLGLGDLVSSLSLYLKQIKEDTHFIFYLPAERNLNELVTFIIKEYLHNLTHRFTYEVVEDRSKNIQDFTRAVEIKGVRDLNTTWYHTTYDWQQYLPFKTQWISNTDGPIALNLNYEGEEEWHMKHHVAPEKFFDKKTNDRLLQLVDNKRFIKLGTNAGHSLQDNVRIISTCRYVIGIENGWTHVCNAMRAPCIVPINNWTKTAILWLHRDHKTLKVIDNKDLYNYLLF